MVEFHLRREVGGKKRGGGGVVARLRWSSSLKIMAISIAGSRGYNRGNKGNGGEGDSGRGKTQRGEYQRAFKRVSERER